ncbi:hypothetical protein QYE76_012655 [Lolium multiflorum]|uniref:RNase H type-1 domain-containing protein n=1 Tax=Lolium multiflorum TaxID=4521 RepID=A0AAD8X3V2_LOLMU|nr:hypothetical protein QYE76_012655 [Lolium multiflorum]
MENYSLLMGATAVMKMAVEMAAVSMEKPSGHFPSRGGANRLLSPDLGFAMAAALEAPSLDGELLLLMGAAAVMKMAVEMAAVSMEKPSGALPRSVVRNRDLSPHLGPRWRRLWKPPVPDSTHWKMHFDGSKIRTGLGAGIVITSPKGHRLDYVLQIHFAASNNVAEYEALIHGLKLAKEIGVRRILCFGDSALVIQQASDEWDARDANMASYRFHVQQLSGFFDGCEFHHVPRANNEAADALSKIGSTQQAIPPGVALQHLRKPSIAPSPDSDSIFVSADPGASQPNSGASQPKSGASQPNPPAP